MIMHRNVAAGLAVWLGLLVGASNADSISTVPAGGAPTTALQEGSNTLLYGYMGSSRSPTGAQGAFGQTFTVGTGQTMEVNGLSFWLKYSAGVTPPSFRAYIQQLNTMTLLYSSDQYGFDQSVTSRQGEFAEHSVNISSPVVLGAGEYVAFFSGVGLSLSGLVNVGGASADALATGAAVVSSASVRSPLGYFGSPTTYRTLNADLAVSIRTPAGAADPGTVEEPDIVEVITVTVPPPPAPATHGPEPASFAMWTILSCTGLIYGCRRRRQP
jgi:hypothetical protein